MKRRDLIKHLREHGCEFHHQGDSHEFWFNLETLKKSPIPRHTEIKTGTVRSICKTLGVPVPKMK